MTVEELSESLLLVSALLAGEFDAGRALCSRDEPCFTTMDLRAMVSRIRRAASSRIDCFDIRPHP